MLRGKIGIKKVKDLFRQIVEKVLSVAHSGDKKKVGEPSRFGFEVIESKSIPEGEALMVSPNGSKVRIINLATGNPKEG